MLRDEVDASGPQSGLLNGHRRDKLGFRRQLVPPASLLSLPLLSFAHTHTHIYTERGHTLDGTIDNFGPGPGRQPGDC